MKVYQIWVQEDGFHWLAEAWDDGTVGDNYSGWEQAKKKAYEAHGPENTRIIVTEIDFDAVVAAFATPVVESKIVGGGS